MNCIQQHDTSESNGFILILVLVILSASAYVLILISPLMCSLLHTTDFMKKPIFIIDVNKSAIRHCETVLLSLLLSQNVNTYCKHVSPSWKK
jgi:hypothetical protein